MKKLISALSLAALAGTSTVAIAAPIQWSSNGHWYEFVAGDFTWQEARADAVATTFNGMQGYLATLTTADEDRFASVTVAGSALAWFGATDEAVEGTWRWIDGPEAGQALTYFHWASDEPNNCCGGENYAQTNWSGNLWNDHGGPANGGQRNGYLVEFAASSAVPEPASVALVLAALGAAGTLRGRRR